MDLEKTRQRYLEWIETPEFAKSFRKETALSWLGWTFYLLAVVTGLIFVLPLGIFFLYKLITRRRRKLKRCREAALRSQCIPAYVVIANTMLLHTKGAVAPALVVGSFEPESESLHAALMKTALLLMEAYGYEGPPKPEIAAVASIMAEDSFREGHRDLVPREVTDGHEIYAFNIMLNADHWGGDELEIPQFPCMAEPGESGAIRMVPHWLWEMTSDPPEAKGWAEDVPTVEEVSYSESGNPVISYSADASPEPRISGGDSELIEAVEAHIVAHFGDGGTVFHELISDQVHIDIHFIPATAERRFHYLVTSGMSERPMAVPEGQEQCRFAELCLALPADWPISQEAFSNEENYWPVRWLKVLARFPHQLSTWLWWGHSMPNGDPAEPIENTGFTGFVLLGPQLAPAGFESLHLDDGREIWFLSPYPVYPDEMSLKLNEGSEALEERLLEANVTECIIRNRANVAG